MARWPHLRAASGPVCWCCRSIGKDLAHQSSFERVALGCAPAPLCNTYNVATDETLFRGRSIGAGPGCGEGRWAATHVVKLT